MNQITILGLILGCLSIISCRLEAQEVPKVTYERYDSLTLNLNVQKGIQIYTGETYVVGTAPSKNGDLDGLLLKIGNEGQFIPVNRFDWGEDEQLNDLVQLANGTLILVGSKTVANGLQQIGWILNVDIKGDVLAEKLLKLENTDTKITHIAQNDREQLLIGGEDIKGRDGFLWICSISYDFDNTEFFSDKTTLDKSTFKDIKALIGLPNGLFFALGHYSLNTKRQKTIWAICLDAKLGKLKEQSFGLSIYHEQITHAIFSPVDSTIHLLGESTAEDIYRDLWYLRFKINDFSLQEKVIKQTRKIDWPKALIPSWIKDQLFYLSRSSSPTGSYSNKIHFSEDYSIELGKNVDLVNVHFILTTEKLWQGFGTWKNAKITGGWSILLTDNSSSVVGKSKIEPSTLGMCTDVKYFSQEKTNKTESRGWLEFTLMNKSRQPLSNIKISTKVTQADKAILVAPIVKVGPIPALQSQKVQIPVYAQLTKVSSSSFPVQIIVTVPGNEICSRVGIIVLNRPKSKSEIVFEGNIKLDWSKEEITLRWMETSTSQLDKVNRKAILRPISSRTENSKEYLIESSVLAPQNGKQLIKHVAEKVKLSPGTNQFILEVLEDDILVGMSDTVSINFIDSTYANLHFLGIAPKDLTLQYNDDDVRDISRFVAKQQASALYQKVYIDTLLSKEQTAHGPIVESFANLYLRAQPDYFGDKKINSNDLVLIYASGHGELFGESFHLLASNYSGHNLAAGSADFNYLIKKYLDNIQCRVVIMIDACHSGMAKAKPYASDIVQRFTNKPGRVILCSSSITQKSFESPNRKNGLFTEALLELLEGRSNTGPPKDTLSLNEIALYLQKRIPELAFELKLPIQQTPQTNISTETLDMDAPLFIKPKN